MAADYTILSNPGLVVLRHWGTLTTEDSFNALMAYQADARAHPALHYLIDMTQVADVRVRYLDVLRHVDSLETRYPRRDREARSAYIAPGDNTFGVARMFQALAEDVIGDRIGIFRTRPAALGFLGLDAGTPLPLDASS